MPDLPMSRHPVMQTVCANEREAVGRLSIFDNETNATFGCVHPDCNATVVCTPFRRIESVGCCDKRALAPIQATSRFLFI